VLFLHPFGDFFAQVNGLLDHLTGFLVRNSTDLFVHSRVSLLAAPVQEQDVIIVQADRELQTFKNSHMLVGTFRHIPCCRQRRGSRLNDGVVRNVETPLRAKTWRLALTDVTVREREQVCDLLFRSLVFSDPLIG